MTAAEVRRIDMRAHTGWGNSIAWSQDQLGVRTKGRGKRQRIVAVTGKVRGWMSPKPRVGDEVIAPMQSGRDAVFVVTGVQHVATVLDMFYADVQLTGYTDGGPIS